MRQKTGRKLVGVMLALAIVVGLLPGVSLTAYAAGATWNSRIYRMIGWQDSEASL